MEEHLVRSHLGGFYISSLDQEFIETYCETCGDYDEVEISWNSEDEKEKIDAFKEYFSRDSIKSKEELEKRINDSEDIDKSEIIDCIIDDILFNSEANTEMLEYLYEDGDLSIEDKEKLKKINNNELKKQLLIVKDNLNKYILNNKEIKNTNKKLSLYLNPKNDTK